jgi:hypothetical protein
MIGSEAVVRRHVAVFGTVFDRAAGTDASGRDVRSTTRRSAT